VWQETLLGARWPLDRGIKWDGIRNGEVPPALAYAVFAAPSPSLWRRGAVHTVRVMERMQARRPPLDQGRWGSNPLPRSLGKLPHLHELVGENVTGVG